MGRENSERNYPLTARVGKWCSRNCPSRGDCPLAELKKEIKDSRVSQEYIVRHEHSRFDRVRVKTGTIVCAIRQGTGFLIINDVDLAI